MSDKEILAELKDKRTKTTVWTRVMGYHRPVEHFNKGKIGEHKERIYFKEPNVKVTSQGNSLRQKKKEK